MHLFVCLHLEGKILQRPQEEISMGLRSVVVTEKAMVGLQNSGRILSQQV